MLVRKHQPNKNNPYKMSKKLFILMTATLLFASAFAQGIKVYDTGRKWDASFDQLAAGQTVRRVAAKGEQTITPESMVSASVTVTDASSVAEYVKGKGYEADVITESTVVVSVPANFIPTLGGREDVLYINESRQFKPLMNKARTETGVTDVIEGTGLETPFTGRGVVVGVIDQGFEYQHPAFADRVVRWGNGVSSGVFRKTMPTGKDKLDDVGHATHVCNIAAGSAVNGSEYYGIATGSDIIQVSSDFQTTSILRQAKSIKEYAEENGQPWVVNLSLGGIIGPHDGTTDYDQSMSELSGDGGIIVAAMGNEGGEKLHAYRTIVDENTPVYLRVQIGSSNTNKGVVSCVWGMSTDGSSNLTIKPVIVSGSKMYEPTDAQLKNLGNSFATGINPYNNRQYATFTGYVSNLISALGLTSTSSSEFFWKVTGKAGDSFHAWVDPSSYEATFAAKGSPYRATSGDDEYMVGEGAASIPTAIAVASYNNSSTSFTSITGGIYDFSSQIGRAGSMSTFSSKGPQLVERPKPAIAAPGGAVISALSKNATDFSETGYEVVQCVTVNSKKYYYGIMNGTSMACPVVTGVVALWLEANPKLSYDDIIEIFKETGRRDSKTGDADENGWNSTAGYGKIDAYNGLKKALEMANASGINEALNSPAPVSIDKRDSEWRVLFNNDESFANISLYSASGSLLSCKKLAAPRRGDEQVVSFAGLNPGVYLLRVATTGSDTTRKLIVK